MNPDKTRENAPMPPKEDQITTTPEEDQVTMTSKEDQVAMTSEEDQVTATPKEDRVTIPHEENQVATPPGEDHITMSPEEDQINKSYWPVLRKILEEDPSGMDRVNLECMMCKLPMSTKANEHVKGDNGNDHRPMILLCGHLIGLSCLADHRVYRQARPSFCLPSQRVRAVLPPRVRMLLYGLALSREGGRLWHQQAHYHRGSETEAQMLQLRIRRCAAELDAPHWRPQMGEV